MSLHRQKFELKLYSGMEIAEITPGRYKGKRRISGFSFRYFRLSLC